MINPKEQKSLKNARKYFREHLRCGDYYTGEKQISGYWSGAGAEKLGLTGEITEKQFLALCEGNDPNTGKFLTQLNLNKKKANGEAKKNASDRRIFYDFTISVPKSISLIASLENPEVKKLHDECAKKAMDKFEEYAQTRVRAQGQNTDRFTKNIICGSFRHETSRAIDPHLHSHCLVFNATYDEVESKWKALQAKEMYKAKEYIQTWHLIELSKGLREMGYKLEFMGNKFEIAGIPEEMIKKFSKRKREIEEQVMEHLEKKGQTGKNIYEVKNQVQRDTRGKKKNLSEEELNKVWEKELTDREKEILTKIKEERLKNIDKVEAKGKGSIKKHVDYAIEKIFERESSVDERKIIKEALWHATGNGEILSDEEIEKEIKSKVVKSDKSDNIVTTAESIIREAKIIELVQTGIKQYDKFKDKLEAEEKLTEEQKKVLGCIITSKDFVTIFRGKAGTGKSYTLNQLKEELKDHNFNLFAPQGKQVEELKKSGFTNALTVALIPQIEFEQNSVIVVDEAGQIGAKAMYGLLQKAKQSNSRIILCGDTKQHGAVEATDAMELIERYTNTTSSELATIRRQDPERAKTWEQKKHIEQYREAVKFASTGRIHESFKVLDKMGSIEEKLGLPEELTKTFLDEYEKNLENAPLVVTQTRASVDDLNKSIRKLHKVKGIVDHKDNNLRTYSVKDFTLAEKKNYLSYEYKTTEEGKKTYNDVLVFVKTYGKTEKRTLAEIIEVKENGIAYKRADGEVAYIGFKHADYFQVAQKEQTALSLGDKIVVKMNDYSENFKRVCNGENLTVCGFKENGNLLAKSEKYGEIELNKDRLVLDYGYATTSYSSQGMTKEKVYLYDVGHLTNATNVKQWYVSISRGRSDVKIFTQNKDMLATCIEALGERKSALESINAQKFELISSKENNDQDKGEKFKQWFESFGKTEQEKQLLKEALSNHDRKLRNDLRKMEENNNKHLTTSKEQEIIKDEKLEKNFELHARTQLERSLKRGAELVQEAHEKEMSIYNKELEEYDKLVNSTSNKLKYFFKIEEKPKAPTAPEKRFTQEEINQIKIELSKETNPLKKEIKETLLKYAECATIKKYKEDSYEYHIQGIILLNKLDPNKNAFEIAEKYRERDREEERTLTHYWYGQAQKQQKKKLINGTTEEKEEAKEILEKCNKSLESMRLEKAARKQEAKELQKEEAEGYFIGYR